MPSCGSTEIKSMTLAQYLTTAPSPKDYDKSTSLVHGTMKRRTASTRLGFSTSVVYFSVESIKGKETTYLMAEKNLANGFTIFSTIDLSKMGSVVRIQSNMSSVTYALYNDDGLQIATILYIVPSVKTLASVAPPRRAQIALMIANSLDVVLDPLWFEITCKDSIRKKGSLDAVVSHTPLFESKAPYTKPDGRCGLNFRGRGREASPKNMQIGASSTKLSNCVLDDNKTVLLQMAKWENDTYHVDFAAPFTIVQAFAFGLAQLDL